MMNITTTSLAHSASPINQINEDGTGALTKAFHELSFLEPANIYTLEGGATVCDKTKGIGKAVFSQILTEKKKKSTYQVLINGKKLVFPASEIGLVFVRSQKITIERENEFIKITEEDAKATTTILYVDPRKDLDGVGYDAYSYMPREVSREEAMQKIQNIKTDFPDFKGYRAAYNRHGVGIFGWEKTQSGYAFYWASPSEEKVHMVECPPFIGCSYHRDGGSCLAKSKDGNVNFQYKVDSDKHYLNGELATPISLTE